MLYAIYTGFGQPIVQGWILEREQKINGHMHTDTDGRTHKHTHTDEHT